MIGFDSAYALIAAERIESRNAAYTGTKLRYSKLQLQDVRRSEF